MGKLKVVTIARVSTGRFLEIDNPHPVIGVRLQHKNTHALTGVCYMIEGNTVIISSRMPIEMLEVICELDVPDRNIKEPKPKNMRYLQQDLLLVEMYIKKFEKVRDAAHLYSPTNKMGNYIKNNPTIVNNPFNSNQGL